MNEQIGLAAARLTSVNPELMAKLTGNIYKDYDYGADNMSAPNGHYSDLGKLPTHPTFSKESKYSGPGYQGGDWSYNDKGQDVFTPSADMINANATRGLANYFKKVEPNGVVQMPAPYSINNIK